jgi:ATP-dependent DNA helicase RecQ
MVPRPGAIRDGAAANVPAYVVFPDRTLIALAAERPTTLTAMRDLHGIGARKLETYGEAFLAAIRDCANA